MRWVKNDNRLANDGNFFTGPESHPRTPLLPLSEEEQRAFDDFFRAEFAPITRHVILLGANVEEAKDATQSALIDLLQNWRSVRAPRAWCRKAAAHHYMRSDAKMNTGVRLSQQEYTARRGEDSQFLASPIEEWEFVLDFVENHLTGVQRQVMAWQLDGYDPQSIAHALGMSPATVRSNLRHARKKLKAALEREYPELAEPRLDTYY